MTAIKMNSIEGLMVENRKHDEIPPPVGKGSWDNVIGYNKAITEQGNREITMDREKLAEVLFQADKVKFGYGSKTLEEASNNPRNPGFGDIYYLLADAIIANQGQIIKAVK